jgi:hypothetical protein
MARDGGTTPVVPQSSSLVIPSDCTDASRLRPQHLDAAIVERLGKWWDDLDISGRRRRRGGSLAASCDQRLANFWNIEATHGCGIKKIDKVIAQTLSFVETQRLKGVAVAVAGRRHETLTNQLRVVDDLPAQASIRSLFRDIAALTAVDLR